MEKWKEGKGSFIFSSFQFQSQHFFFFIESNQIKKSIFGSFLNFMIIQKSKSVEFLLLLIETFLILGIGTAARNGWQVHSYAQDSIAAEEIWPETTREDPRSV